MTIPEALSILGLEGENISGEDIRHTFIKLSKKYHPDATGIKDDTMFKKINEAYSFLREHANYKNDFYFSSKEELKIMLDNLIFNAVSLFDEEIYINIVLPELKNWFENSEPLKTLERNIHLRVEEIKPFLISELKSMYNKFSKNIGTKIDGSFYKVTSSFDFNGVSAALSDSISNLIGVVVTTIIAVVSGGSGVALIATGPLGIVLGGALGLYLFKKNKEELKRKVEDYIRNNSLPIMAKNFVSEKVINKVVEGEEKFVLDLKNKLEEDLKPIYEKIIMLEN